MTKTVFSNMTSETSCFSSSVSSSDLIRGSQSLCLCALIDPRVKPADNKVGAEHQ